MLFAIYVHVVTEVFFKPFHPHGLRNRRADGADMSYEMLLQLPNVEWYGIYITELKNGHIILNSH